MSSSDAVCHCPSDTDTSIVLDRGNNTVCIVNLHGATVVSWKINDQEQLFVSSQAIFDDKKAIRGGVPFVFPHFGPWPLGPQHGFARITSWCVRQMPAELPNGDVQAILVLTDNDESMTLWSNRFRVTYTLILGEKTLNFNITIRNLNIEGEEFSFNLLLHTYFRLTDVQQCQIYGLKGCTYVDKAKNAIRVIEDQSAVTINQFTDRIYENTPFEQIITKDCGQKIRIQKHNFPDTVVWNPWIEQAKTMSDFGDDEYLHMVCVEAGYVTCPVILKPDETFEAGQILELM